MCNGESVPLRKRSRAQIEYEILSHLGCCSGETRSRLATACNLNYQTLTKYLQRLRKDGLVKLENKNDGKGRLRGKPSRIVCSLTPRGRWFALHFGTKLNPRTDRKNVCRENGIILPSYKRSENGLTYAIVMEGIGLLLALAGYVLKLRPLLAATSVYLCGFMDGALVFSIVFALIDFFVRKYQELLKRNL